MRQRKDLVSSLNNEVHYITYIKSYIEGVQIAMFSFFQASSSPKNTVCFDGRQLLVSALFSHIQRLPTMKPLD